MELQKVNWRYISKSKLISLFFMLLWLHSEAGVNNVKDVNIVSESRNGATWLTAETCDSIISPAYSELHGYILNLPNLASISSVTFSISLSVSEKINKTRLIKLFGNYISLWFMHIWPSISHSIRLKNDNVVKIVRVLNVTHCFVFSGFLIHLSSLALFLPLALSLSLILHNSCQQLE